MNVIALRATGILVLAAAVVIVLLWGPDSGVDGVTIIGALVGLLGLWLATEPDPLPDLLQRLDDGGDDLDLEDDLPGRLADRISTDVRRRR